MELWISGKNSPLTARITLCSAIFHPGVSHESVYTDYHQENNQDEYIFIWPIVQRAEYFKIALHFVDKQHPNKVYIGRFILDTLSQESCSGFIKQDDETYKTDIIAYNAYGYVDGQRYCGAVDISEYD